jgi:nucleotide-binding universal stress UspA family protein
MSNPHDAAPTLNGVLVGDDGSARATEALDYAAAEAARRDCDLHVVRAWNVKNAMRPADYSPGLIPSTQEFGSATLEHTRPRAQAAAERHAVADRLHVHAIHGAATKTLLDLSRQADVVVVGAQGLSGITARLLGSVAHTVVREAECPVVVVRGRRP